MPVPPCSHGAPCWGIVMRRAQGGTVLLLLPISSPACGPRGSASAPSQHRNSQRGAAARRASGHTHPGSVLVPWFWGSTSCPCPLSPCFCCCLLANPLCWVSHRSLPKHQRSANNTAEQSRAVVSASTFRLWAESRRSSCFSPCGWKVTHRHGCPEKTLFSCLCQKVI